MKLIPLSRGKKAKVSDRDYARINANKWHFNGKYATRQVPDPSGKHHHLTVYMHNEIMDPGPDQEVDHIDRDKLNCQRENLERKTHAKNLQNRDVKRDNKRIGVQYYPKSGRYQAKMRWKGKNISLGNYDTA